MSKTLYLCSEGFKESLGESKMELYFGMAF